MTVVYHLCGYDKTTERLAAEFPIPTRFLPTVRTFVEPEPDDHDLVLPYTLTADAVVRLAEALGLAIEPDRYHYYFECSDGSDTDLRREVVTTAR